MNKTAQIVVLYANPVTQERWWGPPDVTPPARVDGDWLSFGKFKAVSR
jgi:hypothetical protein